MATGTTWTADLCGGLDEAQVEMFKEFCVMFETLSPTDILEGLQVHPEDQQALFAYLYGKLQDQHTESEAGRSSAASTPVATPPATVVEAGRLAEAAQQAADAGPAIGPGPRVELFVQRFREMFDSIPSADLKAIVEDELEAAHGDPNAAAAAIQAKLADIMGRADTRQVEAQNEAHRAKLVHDIWLQFMCFTEADIRATLERYSWDMLPALEQLMKDSHSYKVEALARTHGDLSRGHIEAVLVACDYDMCRATARLIRPQACDGGGGAAVDVPGVAREAATRFVKRQDDQLHRLQEQVVCDIMQTIGGVRAEPSRPAEPDTVMDQRLALPDCDTPEVTIQLSLEKDGAGAPQLWERWDYVGLYLPTAPDSSPETWARVGAGAGPRCLKFAVSSFGPLEMRLLRWARQDRSYHCIQRSHPFHVGPKFDLRAVSAGDKWHVTWEQTFGGPRDSAWVGMYREGQADNTKYLEMHYVTDRGSLPHLVFNTFPEPAGYVFRMFPERSTYHAVAASPAVHKPGGDSVSAAHPAQGDPGQLTVSVNLVTVDPSVFSVKVVVTKLRPAETGWFARSPDRRVHYIKTPAQEVCLKPLVHSGIYQVRLFANDNVVAESEEFEVHGEA